MMMQPVGVGRRELFVGLDKVQQRQVTTYLASAASSDRNALHEVASRLGPGATEDGREVVGEPVEEQRGTGEEKASSFCHKRKKLKRDFLSVACALSKDAAAQMVQTALDAGDGDHVVQVCEVLVELFYRGHVISDVDSESCPQWQLLSSIQLPSEDRQRLFMSLASWSTKCREHVLERWAKLNEGDPTISRGAAHFFSLLNEELARGEPAAWSCSLCAVKAKSTIEIHLSQGMHRNPRTKEVDNTSILNPYKRNELDLRVGFQSHADTLLEFRADGAQGQDGAKLTFHGMSYDGRRLCPRCICEARNFVVSLGHNTAHYHMVDHTRRETLQNLRRLDRRKSVWLAQERRERLEGALLESICDARRDAAARARIQERKRVQESEEKLLSARDKVKQGKYQQLLRSVGMQECDAAVRRHCLQYSKKCCDGALPVSLLRLNDTHGEVPWNTPQGRAPLSIHLSDFLANGTPVTVDGVETLLYTVPGAERAADKSKPPLTAWRNRAVKISTLLRHRAEFQKMQREEAKSSALHDKCGKWQARAVALDSQRQQRQKAAEREKELRRLHMQKERIAKRAALQALRETSECRAMADAEREQRAVEVQVAALALEAAELADMEAEEAAQRQSGDKYWGVMMEGKRLADLQLSLRTQWLERIKKSHVMMVTSGCVADSPPERLIAGSSPPVDTLLKEAVSRLQLL